MGRVDVERLGGGVAWLDTGTHEAMMQASNFIEAIESRQGLKVGCIEEIAYRKGYIDADQIRKLALPVMKNSYGSYLLDILTYEGTI